MAVISHHKLWPYSRVPYVAESPEIESWLLEINAAIGFPLLVDKGKSDFDYISAKLGDGKSDSIGYRKSIGEHLITASKKFSMQHELLHALGFHHEQLHRDGPWGLFGTKAQSAEKIDRDLLQQWGINMLPEASKPPVIAVSTKVSATTDEVSKKTLPVTGHQRRSSIGGGEKVILEVNQAAIDQHKRAFQEALDDNNVVHWKSCDFDSVMMYGEMRNAAKKIVSTKVFGTGKHPKAPCLSNGDVEALKEFYKCTIVSLLVQPISQN